MANKGIGGHSLPNKGNKDDWLTPPEIVQALGPFDLDPCAANHRPWPTAAAHYTVEQDGLSQAWHGAVWLNPPYGPQTTEWLSRLANHRNGIALMFARTETHGFKRWVWESADAALFIYGRLHFHHPDGRRARANAGGPSVLVAYGEECARRLERCSIPGYLIRLREHDGVPSDGRRGTITAGDSEHRRHDRLAPLL